jgi:acyl carrier protein
MHLEPSSRVGLKVGANMDSARSQAPRDIIAEIVARTLRSKGVGSISVDDNLRDAGLSSLELVNVMLAVEDAFDLTFPQGKLTPDNFRTIGAIEALVAGMI